MKNRVYCLYRVSTLRQVDYDDQKQADIPMQKRACLKFAAKMGWEVVGEAQEDGISGYKVRALDRDKIQFLRDLARNEKFDILLVYMFDRLGRIADETPFILEWFVKHGVRVWSTQEGEQRFDNHMDKLINYIRFWQAELNIRASAILAGIVYCGHCGSRLTLTTSGKVYIKENGDKGEKNPICLLWKDTKTNEL